VSTRVRFAPSPTGGLHLGGARTALYNWLVARGSGGAFVLRFEDTDAAMVVPGAAESIMEDLRWLGIDWDEGPDVGGALGPYRQSERGAHYSAVFERLRAAGAMYPCFCTREQLAADREVAAVGGLPPRYSGACRLIAPADAAVRIAAGEAHVWRFSVAHEGRAAWVDEVFGRTEVQRSDIGDFVLVRSDGSATYDLACVTDDIEMRITLVLRGADHLTNTARQLLIYEALGVAPPRFGHLSLVTGPGGVPLSKSAGATSIHDLAAEGHLPSAVVQHVALLGWSDPADRQVLTTPELIEAFSLARVSTSSAAHDPARLAALTTRHLHALPPAALTDAVRSHLDDVPEWLDLAAFIPAVAGDLALATDIRTYTDAVAGVAMADTEARELLASPEASDVLALLIGAVGSLDAAVSGQDAEAAVRAAAREAGMPLRLALPVLRAALTGRTHGLPVALLLGTIPRDVSLERLSRAVGCHSPHADAI